jgi:hypothetical protein
MICLNDFVIIEEADGSLTVNLNGGEITIGENHDKERQEFIETND